MALYSSWAAKVKSSILHEMSGSRKPQPEEPWWKRAMRVPFQSPEEFEKWSKAFGGLFSRVLGFAFLVCLPLPFVYYVAYDDLKVLLISPVLLIQFYFMCLERRAENPDRQPETQPRETRPRHPLRWLRVALPILLALAPLAKGEVRAAIAKLFHSLISDLKVPEVFETGQNSPAPDGQGPPKKQVTVHPNPAQENQLPESDGPKEEKALKERAKSTPSPSKSRTPSGKPSQQQKPQAKPSPKQQLPEPKSPQARPP
jgi:hypothetical protein